jgi:hypothetical protein
MRSRAVIVIPDAIWERLLDEFARTRGSVERVAFLDGIRSGDIGVVTTLTIPDSDLYPGFYDVSSDAMSQAGTHLRRHAMTRLAQVHTHGLGGCHHSLRDDAMAYSQREGAISMVLPYHGTRRPRHDEGATHRRTEDGWVVLESGATAAAIEIVPSLLDFRRSQWIESPTATKAPSTGVWRRLMRFVQRRSR